MLIFSVGLIAYNSRSVENDLRDKLTKLTTFSKESLSSALWQYNYDYVRDYTESLFLYEDLVFARVATPEMEISKKARPDYVESSFEDFRLSSRFIVSETLITRRETTIGNMQLVFSR